LLAVLASVAALAAPSALAHEFWIMPDAFGVTSGSLVRVRIFHGERLRGDVVPRRNAYVDRFDLAHTGGPTPVLGADQSRVGFVRPGVVGPATLVYQSAEYAHVMAAESFEAYLAEEKLTDALASRRERAESAAPAREVYIRCAKALLSVAGSEESASGTHASTPADSPVGLPFEIVLSTGEPAPLDAASEAVGTKTRIRATVLLNGRPAADIRVVCTSSEDPDTLLEARTDEAGLVAFDSDGAGVWILTALHIERTTARDDADWKSYWASLTFEVNR
jgi:uncharacterized GH25 family protein